MVCKISSGAGVLPVGVTWSTCHKDRDGNTYKIKVGVPNLKLLAAKIVFNNFEKYNKPEQGLDKIAKKKQSVILI